MQLAPGGGSVMAWTHMAASGMGSLVFIDDVTINSGGVGRPICRESHLG